MKGQHQNNIGCYESFQSFHLDTINHYSYLSVFIRNFWISGKKIGWDFELNSTRLYFRMNVSGQKGMETSGQRFYTLMYACKLDSNESWCPFLIPFYASWKIFVANSRKWQYIQRYAIFTGKEYTALSLEETTIPLDSPIPHKYVINYTFKNRYLFSIRYTGSLLHIEAGLLLYYLSSNSSMNSTIAAFAIFLILGILQVKEWWGSVNTEEKTETVRQKWCRVQRRWYRCTLSCWRRVKSQVSRMYALI